MRSELSTNAVSQIKLFRPWSTDYELRVLYLYKLANFSDRLLKHRLVHQDFLKEKDVQDIFALGKPFVLDGWDYPLPYPIVPEIVEAFQRLPKEPSFLDITLADEGRSLIHNPTDVWPQVYDSYFPCDPCKTVETIAVKRSGIAFVDCDFSSSALEHAPGWEPPGHRDVTLEFVVEKLHISSKHFDKQLVVELRFVLEGAGRDVLIRPPTAPDKEKAKLHTVTIRLVDGDCRRFMEAVARKRKTILLIADFAAEVYGFVDRADLGTSLIANLELYEVIFKLRHKLPVHHLTCECEEILVRATCGPPLPEDYWLRLHHFRRDLAYSDVRRFKIPATAGFRSTAADSALIRRYLSNSYVADFKARPDDATFVVTMLGALVERNFSLDRLRVCALQVFPPADVRLTDAVLHSGLRLRALKLCIDEHCLHRLIKMSDFFRMPTVQRIKELKLLLVSPTSSTRMPVVQWLMEFNLLQVHPESSTRRQRAVVSAPLWTDGIHLLRNCALFRVDWECSDRGRSSDWCALQAGSSHSKRGLESVALRLVQICEKFERGELSETVEHFVFRFRPHAEFPFNGDNKEASEITVGTEDTCSPPPIAGYTWDVYRFQNAATGEWLTGSVGRPRNEGWPSYMHIVKGQTYPDASYVR